MAGLVEGETMELVLTQIRLLARDTNLYVFEREDGRPLPGAEPGAHIGIILPNGIERQYSLTQSGVELSSYAVGVKKDAKSRGGSNFMHDSLRVGAKVKIAPPRNNFPLKEDAAHTVLIAGGIGITPVFCMVKRLAALGRKWDLYYSARTRKDAAFLAELSKFPESHFHFDDEQEGKFLDVPAIVRAAPSDAELYCCGPEPMIAAFEGATAKWPPEQIHVEYFTPKFAAAAEGGFVVVLARSQREVAVPKGKSILQCVRDLGVQVPFSCEEGICGACETRVIEGTPDHRDSILTESERKESATMMICCSGSKSPRLVLDI